MRYTEKDVESLEEGTIYRRLNKQDSYRRSNRVWRRYYGRSYRNKLGKLSKINIENLLGRSIHQVCERYLHLLPKGDKGVYKLMDYLDINTLGKGDMFHDAGGRGRWIIDRWGPIYYLCPKNNTIKMYLSKHARAIWSKRKMRNAGTTREERMKRFYKERSIRRKFVRERKRERREKGDTVAAWIFAERRRKEKELEKQKLIQHGFDPVNSFRNVPNT